MVTRPLNNFVVHKKDKAMKFDFKRLKNQELQGVLGRRDAAKLVFDRSNSADCVQVCL